MVALVVGLFLLSLTSAAAVGAVVYRYTNGKAISAVRSATTTGDTWSSSAEAFTAIAGSQVSINIPSGQKAVLIITFSTQYLCLGAGYCAVAAYVDGTRVTPQEVVLEYATGTTRSTSFQWITDKIGSGPHSVVMAASKVGSGTVSLTDRTLTVLRAKY